VQTKRGRGLAIEVEGRHGLLHVRSKLFPAVRFGDYAFAEGFGDVAAVRLLRNLKDQFFHAEQHSLLLAVGKLAFSLPNLRGPASTGSGLAKPGCGMSGVMDLLKLLDRQVSVDLRRLELGVSKQGLDHPSVGSVLENVRCAGVAEEMAGPRLAMIGGLRVSADHFCPGLRGQNK